MLIKTRGVVSKAVNFGEGDKIVTLLSDRLGKVQAMAKGARRTRSKLVAGTQLFCYGEFLLFRGKSWYYVDQVEILDTFYRIRNDLDILSYSTYIIELANEMVQPEQPSGRLFQLVVETLKIFTEEGINPEVVLRGAEIKALDFAGFRPHISKCVNCGNKDEKTYFSPMAGGILCRDCAPSDRYGYEISPVTIQVMNIMLKWNMKKLSRLRVEQSILKELQRIMRAYVSIHIDKDFPSNRFMDSIRKLK